MHLSRLSNDLASILEARTCTSDDRGLKAEWAMLAPLFKGRTNHGAHTLRVSRGHRRVSCSDPILERLRQRRRGLFRVLTAASRWGAGDRSKAQDAPKHGSNPRRG